MIGTQIVILEFSTKNLTTDLSMYWLFFRKQARDGFMQLNTYSPHSKPVTTAALVSECLCAVTALSPLKVCDSGHTVILTQSHF